MSQPPRQTDDDGWTMEAGAYVLGALEADEAAAFEGHLETCQRCRDEVEFLRGAADALPVAVPQIDPSDAVRDRIMAVVREEESLLRAARGERPRAAAASAPWWRLPASWRPAPLLAGATALFVAGVIAASLLGGSGPSTRTVAASVDSVAAPAGAARLVRYGGRAELRVTGMPPAPRSRIYQVWLKRDGQDPKPTDALFAVNRAGAGSVAVPGVKGADDVLVTAEPLGGSTTPSGPPIVTVRLS